MEATTRPEYQLGPAADLIKRAQITADYQQLVFKLAGPLEKSIVKVFPGNLMIVYLLTDIGRRQVWNAYLSSPRVAPQLDRFTQQQAAELRVKLLTCRSYDLIVDGYGSAERGLTGLYGKLGFEAHPREFYLLFHQTLTENESLRRSLNQAPALDKKALAFLFTLPRDLQYYGFALELVDHEASPQFLELYTCIQRREFPNKRAMIDRLHNEVRLGRGYRTALRSILHALPFPAPIVPDEGKLRFIRNGLELTNIAKTYRNCLRSEVSDALSGDCQYYEWVTAQPAVIGLKRHRGATWYISAIRLENNELPSEQLETQIRNHFARHGIGERRCIADLFDRYLGGSIDVTEELAELEAMR